MNDCPRRDKIYAHKPEVMNYLKALDNYLQHRTPIAKALLELCRKELKFEPDPAQYRRMMHKDILDLVSLLKE